MVRVRPTPILPVLLAVLTALPFAGCLESNPGPGGFVMASGLFDFTPIERGEPGAVPVADCPALEQTLRQRALDQARVALDQGIREEYGWGWGFGWRGGIAIDAVAMEDSASGAASGAPASAQSGGSGYSASGAQVTGTNNQEQAADEADLVKTDGEWTYVLSNGVLHILQSRTVGALREHATLSFGANVWGGELILERRKASDPKDDRLVVILPNQSPPDDQPLARPSDGGASVSDSMYYGGSMTRIVVLSLADRADPRVEHEAWVDGQPMGTRLVDGVAHVVVQTWEQQLGLRTWVGPEEDDLRRLDLSWDEYYALGDDERRRVREAIALRVDAQNVALLDSMDLEAHLPTVLATRFGFLIPEAVSDETCRSVLSLPQSTGRAFTTIVSLGVGLPDTALATKTTQVLGGSAIVYADSGALVLASPSQDAWWFWAQPGLEEATDLLWFDLDGLDVTLRASGRAAGSVLDSFSLDVHDGELRVATTVGQFARWWVQDPAPMVSQLVVFREAAGILVPRGAVGGLAPGERIWSARFTDDRAYLVTFRNMDPLWVIDLGDTVRVLGELEIPGVSTYLHPVDDETLLAIGYGPGPDGQNLDWNSVQVSLFDLSDLSKPRRADVLDLTPSNGYSWSGATQEHRAFTYWEAIDTLAVPVATTISHEVRTGFGTEWRNEQHVGLQLIYVDRGSMELSIHGEVDQDHLAIQDGYWGAGIERSWFLGYPDTGPVSVYAMSPYGVTSHDFGSLARQGSVAFPHPEPAYYY